jgi:hypothetical protein
MIRFTADQVTDTNARRFYTTTPGPRAYKIAEAVNGSLYGDVILRQDLVTNVVELFIVDNEGVDTKQQIAASFARGFVAGQSATER